MILHRKLDRAVRALERAGFTDCGGQEWKPPLGPVPEGYATPQADVTGLVEALEKIKALDWRRDPADDFDRGILSARRQASEWAAKALASQRNGAGEQP